MQFDRSTTAGSISSQARAVQKSVGKSRSNYYSFSHDQEEGGALPHFRGNSRICVYLQHCNLIIIHLIVIAQLNFDQLGAQQPHHTLLLTGPTDAVHHVHHQCPAGHLQHTHPLPTYSAHQDHGAQQLPQPDQLWPDQPKVC